MVCVVPGPRGTIVVTIVGPVSSVRSEANVMSDLHFLEY